jgi:hypothetical protein
MKSWISQLNPKVYHSGTSRPIMSEEELQREARRALANRGITVVGRM